MTNPNKLLKKQNFHLPSSPSKTSNQSILLDRSFDMRKKIDNYYKKENEIISGKKSILNRETKWLNSNFFQIN